MFNTTTTWLGLFLLFVAFPVCCAGRPPEWSGQEQPCRVEAPTHPDDVSSWLKLLDTYSESRDKIRVAAAVATRAIKRFPDDRLVMGRAARAYRQAGMLPEAQAVVEQMSLEGSKDDGVALSEMLYMNIAVGRREQAREILDHILELCSGDPKKEAVIKRAFDAYGPTSAIRPNASSRNLVTCGQAKMQFVNNQEQRFLSSYAVSTYIDGNGPFLLELDSGGTAQVVLNPSVAERLEIADSASGSLVGATGEQDVRRGVVKSMRIGSIVVKNVPVQVIQNDDEGSSVGTIGLGVFATHRVTFDNKNRTFHVSPSSDQFTQAWKTRRVGFWEISSKILVMTEINGQSRACVLDCGAGMTIGSSRLVRELFAEGLPQTGTYKFRAFGRTEEREVVALPDAVIRFGGIRAKYTNLFGLDFIDDTLSNELGTDIGLIIGNDILKTFKKWTIDYPQRTIMLER